MSKMELKDYVSEKLDLIRNSEHDPEQAHGQEKDLWETVLRLAADGYDVKESAKEALKSKEIDFPRWFA